MPTMALSDRLASVWQPVVAVAWSVRRSLRLLRWLHIALALVVAIGGLADRPALVAGSATLGAALLGWPRVHGRSWRALVERWHTKRSYTTRWDSLADKVGLSVHRRATTAGGPAVTVVPRLVRVTVSGPVVVLRVRLVAGLTVADVERAAPRLAVAANVPRVLVDPDGHAGARLTLTVRDLLGHPFASTLPDPATVDVTRVPRSVPLGRVENGRPWLVPVGPSTLVAGAAGAGKGSVLWGPRPSTRSLGQGWLGPPARDRPQGRHGTPPRPGPVLDHSDHPRGRRRTAGVARRRLRRPDPRPGRASPLPHPDRRGAATSADRRRARRGHRLPARPAATRPRRPGLVDPALPRASPRIRGLGIPARPQKRRRPPAGPVPAHDRTTPAGYLRGCDGLRRRGPGRPCPVPPDHPPRPRHRLRPARRRRQPRPRPRRLHDDGTIRHAATLFATPVRQDIPRPDVEAAADPVATRAQTERASRAPRGARAPRQPRAPRARTSSRDHLADTQLLADSEPDAESVVGWGVSS